MAAIIGVFIVVFIVYIIAMCFVFKGFLSEVKCVGKS